MEGARIAQGLEIFRRDERRPDLLAAHEFQPIAEIPLDAVALGLQRGRALMAQHAHDARHGIGTGDRERLDGLAHQGNAFEGEAIERMGLVAPRDARDMVEAGGETGCHEAAIAPRSAPADALRLQHHDRFARPGEMEGRGQPGEPAADDADIGLDVTLEDGALPGIGEGAGVVGVDIGHGWRQIYSIGHPGESRGLSAGFQNLKSTVPFRLFSWALGASWPA